MRTDFAVAVDALNASVLHVVRHRRQAPQRCQTIDWFALAAPTVRRPFGPAVG